MKLLLIFIFYQLIQLISLPFVGLYILLRKIKKKPVFGSFRQRMGFVPKSDASKKVFWLHAVSVGEVLSMQRLIDELKKQHENAFCYVTTGTLAGKKMAHQQLNADQVSFMPYDFLLPMFSAFGRIKPAAIIAIEAEIWPNFLILATWKKIPMYLLNARINKRSEKWLQHLSFIFAPLYQTFTHIYTQSEQDVVTIQNMFSIDAAMISFLGNIKAFNVELKKQEAEKFLEATLCKEGMRATLLVGSVHPGELEVYLEVYQSLKPKYRDLKMIIAPRHFNWKEDLMHKIEQIDASYVMWDQERIIESIPQFVDTVLAQHDILLVCTIGKLFNLYPLADIFCLGGTFVPVGGHNLLEPAVWGRPSIVGPYHANCQDHADQLQHAGALAKVDNLKDLQNHLEMLLEDHAVRKTMGDNASAWLEDQAREVHGRIKHFLYWV